MEVSGQLHIFVTLNPRETALDNHFVGGWVGPGAGQRALEKRKTLAPARN
jgi:hypothetical protein